MPLNAGRPILSFCAMAAFALLGGKLPSTQLSDGLPSTLCPDGSELISTSVELYDAAGALVHRTQSGDRKICRTYPADGGFTWDGFSELFTTQHVLPHWLVGRDIATIRLVSPNTSAQRQRSRAGQEPLAPRYLAYHQDVAAWSSTTLNGHGVNISYPPKGGVAGDPAHVSLFPDGGNGAQVQATWVSFAQADAAYECFGEKHCCRVEADLDRGLRSAKCDISPPAWRCMAPGGQPWAEGANVSSVDFVGGMGSTSMADGKPVLIHLADAADVSVPITNSFVEHRVRDSDACRALCSKIFKAPGADLFGDADASACSLASGSVPAFRAAAGYGPISVTGFGRINGMRMMQAFLMFNRSVWLDPAAGVLNGYGSVFQGFRTIADAEPHTRWRIMSGLLELSSGAAATSEHPFALDVSETAVAWGAKRGDGSLRLQFPRVPLDKGGPAASNRPARLFDVKTPGGWVDATDGPRVSSDGSRLRFLYLHHADDNVKIDSTAGQYEHLTLLQGNAGSAVELGTYGIGLERNAVRDARAHGIYVHRIVQTSQDDQLGSVLGSRTCPWGIKLQNISVSGVYVPAEQTGNRISAVINVGTYGSGDSSRFEWYSSLDRWFFCSNSWWLDNEKIVSGGRAATFADLRFEDWNIEVRPTVGAWLYNFHPGGETVFQNVSFSHRLGAEKFSYHVGTLSDLGRINGTGVYALEPR